MTIKINFSVDKNKLFYLAKVLNISKSRSVLLKDSKNNLDNVKKMWQRGHKPVLNYLLNKFSGSENYNIKIVIVPEYFFVGACEPIEKLVIYGQPPRCKNFSTAIIIHEITHILLSRITIKRCRIIDEAICFMAENIVYEKLEKKSIREIWKMNELDKFHREALKLSFKFSDYFFVDNSTDIKNIIRLLFENIRSDILKTVPQIGLFKNLHKNITFSKKYFNSRAYLYTKQ